MDIAILIFLSSGLFLGWSLGANDAANVFGTAVGSRMIRFTTAAIICSVFIILGAVFSGAGAAHGLGELGNLNALPGAFVAAFCAALTVYWMTVARLPGFHHPCRGGRHHWLELVQRLHHRPHLPDDHHVHLDRQPGIGGDFCRLALQVDGLGA
jgi:hypothetical protein